MLRDESDVAKRTVMAMPHTDWEFIARETVSNRRRGKRVNLRYPVEVTGFDRAGKLFCENTVTTNVSATGCRVELKENVERGNTVAIKMLVKNSAPDAPVSKPQMFQIIWRARKNNVWVVGALKMTGDKFWQVDFPPQPQAASS
jgi:hypothetical protein